LLYAVADITFLQEYCGNEAVGIPTYTQPTQTKNRRTFDSSARTALISSPSPDERQTPELPTSDEECFCCCPHTTLSFNAVKLEAREMVSVKQSESDFADNHLHSDSHPAQLYQPPKFA